MEPSLTHLAVEGGVATSTQNHALAAVLFLYKKVLGIELPSPDGITRAKRPRKSSVVPTQDEVRALAVRASPDR